MNRRLVIEVSDVVNGLLNKWCRIEGTNKSTLLNRSMRVYDLVQSASLAGQEVLFRDPMTGVIIGQLRIGLDMGEFETALRDRPGRRWWPFDMEGLLRRHGRRGR